MPNSTRSSTRSAPDRTEALVDRVDNREFAERISETTSPTLLEELAREVLVLRAELSTLREQLEKEVRTRRLIVVDDDGFEGIVAEISKGADDEHNASVRVASRTDAGTWAILHNTASIGMDGRTVSCGLFLSGGGNGVGMFEVHATELDRDDPGGEFRYDPRLDVIEDHGPRVSLDIEGLQFDR